MTRFTPAGRRRYANSACDKGTTTGRVSFFLEAIPSRKAESINTRQAESITIVPKGLEVRMHHILGIAGSGGEALKDVSHKHAYTVAVQQLVHVARRRALLHQLQVPR
jgi:hypothetical protein